MSDHLRVETIARCNQWAFIETKRTGMLQIEGEPKIYSRVASIRKGTRSITAFFHVSGRMFAAKDELGRVFGTNDLLKAL